MSKSPKALIMAGGTGGHIFPGIALANVLKEKGWQIEWMGTADRMEADIVPKHDIQIHFIDVKGVRGNGIKRLLTMPFMLLNAVRQARAVLKNSKPDVVIGFGGYASGPGGIAAKLLKIPLILHEQNAVMGMTNKYLSRIATKTLLAFPNAMANQGNVYGEQSHRAHDKMEVVGNPVRAEIAQLNKKPKRLLNVDNTIHILIMGGSLGAQVFNEQVPAILGGLSEAENKVKIRHQAGKNNSESVKTRYQNQAINDANIVVSDFIDDMTDAYSWADIIICRAGALTVSEVAASGNAAIFVPLPHAVDDHQTENANWLVLAQAAKLVKQNNLQEQLPTVLQELLHAPNLISEMQQRARQHANLGTTDRMLSLCQAIGRR